MPAFSKGTYDRNFEQVAFLLKNDGDISNIFKTDKGFEIVQLVSKKPVLYKQLKHVTEDIRAKLLHTAFVQQFNVDVKKLSSAPTDQEIEAFAQKHHAIKKQAIAPQSVGDYNAALKGVFSIPVRNVTFGVEKDQSVLMLLTTIEDAYLPSFEKVKAAVRNDYLDQKAESLMREEIQQAQKEAKTSEFAILKERCGLSLEQVRTIKLSDKKTLEPFEKKGIAPAYIEALRHIGAVLPVPAKADQVYLVRLDAIAPIDQVGYHEELLNLKSAVLREEIARYVQGFVASLYRIATIKLNESIIAKVKDSASS
jgi:hypothetical protein